MRENVNIYISGVFISVFSLAMGLILWNAAFDQNPIADAMVGAVSSGQIQGY